MFLNMSYETERLILRILTPEYCKDVLDFQLRNRSRFEMYEPLRPRDFYTYAYQQNLLKLEMKSAEKLSAVRFYVFSDIDPYTIIGTVCLHNITRASYNCCEIGYRFDYAWQHRGFAKEAVAEALSIAFGDLNLHRVFARVVADNLPSIRLLKSLHFIEEGIEFSSIEIQGKWTDHLRFAIINPLEC